MRARGGMLVGVLVGVLALAAAGCGGGDDDGGGASATTAAPETTAEPTTTAAAGGGGENEFQLVASGFAWDKTSLDMTAGAQVSVEVTNEDTAQHSFTFDEASVDEVVAGGEDATASFTAPAAGEYEFRCKFHGSMTGTVNVT
jgi:plastocyanin